MSGWTASHAGSIVTTPPLLQPGDQYQLVFVTADTFSATSTDISTYNVEVTAEAALDPTLAAFDTLNDVTWTVIGSTATVNANVNAPSSGSVYTLDGTMVASSAQSLYSDQCPVSVNMCPGPLFAPIDITQLGTVLVTSVWTGSLSGGVAAGDPSLGYDYSYLGATADPSDDVTQGCTPDTSSFWADCDYNPSSELFSLYALSSEITVPTPEPEPVGLMLPALILPLLFGVTRRRKKRQFFTLLRRLSEMEMPTAGRLQRRAVSERRRQPPQEACRPSRVPPESSR